MTHCFPTSGNSEVGENRNWSVGWCPLSLSKFVKETLMCACSITVRADPAGTRSLDPHNNLVLGSYVAWLGPPGKFHWNKCNTRNVGQCPTWWPPCRIQVAPSVQRYKVWLTPCRAVTLPRLETRWNLQRCLKLTNRSQPLVGQSSPYCEDVSETLLFNNLFAIVDTCPSCEDIARQSCAMVPRWRFFESCISSELRAAHFRPAF